MPSKTFERVLTTEEKTGALRGELFLNRELIGLDFSSADLQKVRFERTSLVRCNFAGTDLREATFAHCDLHNVVLTGAILESSRWDGTTLTDVDGLTESNRRLIEQSGGSFQHALASLR